MEFSPSNIMCQIKNNTNPSGSSFGIADRDQKIIPTYSRMKKARKSSISRTSAPSASAHSLSSDSKISAANSWKNHCQHGSKANCDCFLNWHINEQSDLCDKGMTQLNMDQSSCVLSALTNSLDRFRHIATDKDESTRNLTNIQQNIHLDNSQCIEMIKGRQFHSQHNDKTSSRHRTIKRFGNTSKFCRK